VELEAVVVAADAAAALLVLLLLALQPLLLPELRLKAVAVAVAVKEPLAQVQRLKVVVAVAPLAALLLVVLQLLVLLALPLLLLAERRRLKADVVAVELVVAADVAVVLRLRPVHKRPWPVCWCWYWTVSPSYRHRHSDSSDNQTLKKNSPPAQRRGVFLALAIDFAGHDSLDSCHSAVTRNSPMVTRREFAKLALSGIPFSAALAPIGLAQRKINSTVNGVQIGAQSYSFRDLPLDGCLKSMVVLGLGACELYAPHVEAKDPATWRTLSRTTVRDWRLTTSLDVFKNVRKRFDDAGIELVAYNYSFKDDFTDDEINRGFDMANALGVGIITASSTLTVAKRVVPFAEKHNMTVAFHGHDDITDPNQFAKPEAFAAAMAMSKHFQINLDIGHFTAAGYDPVKYISEHHEHILVLHIKDRKSNRGANVPWGQGDTPIKQVLQLLRDKKYKIPALIEYEYTGADTVAEVKKCFQYAKDALA